MSLNLTIIFWCLLANAFFAGIETGVISINRMRLRHHVDQGHRWATILNDLLDHPDRLLGTTLIGSTVCLTSCSVLATSVGLRFGAWGAAVSEALLAVIVLVLAEYLPKAWFQSQPLERCRPFAGMLQAAAIALQPLIRLVTWLTQWIVREPPGTVERRHALVTRDELKVLAQEGAEHGGLSPKQRIMLHRVFELAGKTAAQAMLPRAALVHVSSQTTVEGFFRVSQGAHFTRLPVYDDTQRTFVGIVNLFDVLGAPAVDSQARITEFMRPPQFIRDTTPLSEIFPLMRRSRQPMCLVTNAQTEVVGLLTVQDVVEEIVGKL